MVRRPKALILTGKGINCDGETLIAFTKAGAEAHRVHINDLISGKERLDRYHILSIPGGFSYGDDLGAGMALANKMRVGLEASLRSFIREGRLIIGICNGFQVLVKLGLLPALDRRYFIQSATLTFNASGHFEDRWVRLQAAEGNPCVFLHGIRSMYLPVRHGEGRFLAPKDTVSEMTKKRLDVLCYADDTGAPTMEYPANPNGSMNAVAGVCDQTGRIFGMMPHPEACAFFENHPRWTRIREERLRRGLPLPREGEGLQVFRNAVIYARSFL